MNDYNDLFKNMLKTALLAQFQMQNTDTRKLMAGMFDGTNERRRYLEYHPSIHTNITDKDMLLLQIDHALDSGDAERFMQLTGELKKMGVLV